MRYRNVTGLALLATGAQGKKCEREQLVGPEGIWSARMSGRLLKTLIPVQKAVHVPVVPKDFLLLGLVTLIIAFNQRNGLALAAKHVPNRAVRILLGHCTQFAAISRPSRSRAHKNTTTDVHPGLCAPAVAWSGLPDGDEQGQHSGCSVYPQPGHPCGSALQPRLLPQ